MVLEKKHKIIIGVMIGVVVLAIAGGVWAYIAYKHRGGANKVPVKFSSDQAVSKLDGTKASKDVANRHPLAVMVENHPDARPQAGLDKASVIYEAVAEGGITRFMAIFGPREADEVGPVRSARVYFVDWAEEYNALYAHAGGAQNALTKISEDNVLDLPHNNTAFWRREGTGKALEHTLYASVPKLYEYAKSKGYDTTKSDYRGWKFKTDVATASRPQAGKNATINFSNSTTYQVQWKYDPATNLYKRFLAGSEQKDEKSGQQLTAKNVVIATYTRQAVESGGKTVYTMNSSEGSGEAKVLMDGTVIDGTWKKSGPKQRTLFYDKSGKEIQFNPGVSWIEIVNPDSGSATVG